MPTTPEALYQACSTACTTGDMTAVNTVALGRIAEEAYTANLIELVKIVQDPATTQQIVGQICDRLGIEQSAPAPEQEWQR